MTPRVLLVYANPAVTATPVVPYGMECVAHAFELAGCKVEMLAPFFEPDPLTLLKWELARPYDLVGFSVRNIDDALVVRSELGRGDIDITFLLDEVRPLVAEAVATLGADRVLLGGSAISAGALPVMRYLGGHIAIRGPADDLAWRIGRSLAKGEGVVLPDDPRVVVDARAPAPLPPVEWKGPRGPTPRLGPYVGLALARHGRLPVRISVGCDRRCAFCVEARFTGYTVRARPVDEITGEIDRLVNVGIKRFWLSCSELNVPDARHAKAVLRALAGRGLDLQVFIQPAPVDDELLDLLEAAGVDPEGLSFELGHLDDRILRAGGGPANRRSIDKLVETWLRRGYQGLGGSLLLGAHPAESEATLRSAMEAALEIDRALPGGFGLSYACGGRVYPESALADRVTALGAAAFPHLYTSYNEPLDPSFVRPVVYCRPWAPRRLLAWVKDQLRSARGNMGPMNVEAACTPTQLEAEALVNRGLWRLQEDRHTEAAECFRRALDHVPDHLEGLAQLSMLLANRLDDPDGARQALARLVDALPPGDARRAEIDSALARLDKLDSP